jgi:hypothetical protein
MEQKQYNLINFFVILAYILILTSCGAGNDYHHPQPVNKGVFLDSAVEGLTYVTKTLSGMTDSNGTFEYRRNELISFYIGKILIGQAIAQPQITPMDLFADVSDIAAPCVINLCRFLQALDTDMDPENGITITPMIHNMLSNDSIAIDFDQSINTFETDIANSILDQTGIILPTAKSAQKHLRQTLYGMIIEIKIETEQTESIPAGMSTSFQAYGRFEKKTNLWIDITNQVTWSTSKNNVATMNNIQSGVLDSYEMGAIRITASLDSESSFIDFHIQDPILINLRITPQNPFLHPYNAEQFKALGIFSNQTTQYVTNKVTWSSKNVAIATVSNENDMQGEVRALSAGSTEIVAEYNGRMASADITVYNGDLTGIQIQPDNETIAIAKGFHKQLRAFGIYSDDTRPDITEQVLWQSNRNSIATVSNVRGHKGLIEAVAMGETQIEASLQGISSFVYVTVTEAVLEQILIKPQNKIIPLYSQEQYTAEAIFSDMTVDNITEQVEWSSTNPQVAIFIDSSHKGRINAESPGMSTIMAAYESLTGSTFLTISDADLDSIIVKPQSISIPLGSMNQFTATGIFTDEIDDDITDKVNWTSSDITVARVSNEIPNKGLVNAISVGTAHIRATFQDKTGYSSLAVLSPELISIQISPDIFAIEIGETRQLYANGYYTNSTINNITNLVYWISSKPDIIHVSNDGLIEGVSSGQAEISAELNNKSQFIKIVVY